MVMRSILRKAFCSIVICVSQNNELSVCFPLCIWWLCCNGSTNFQPYLVHLYIYRWNDTKTNTLGFCRVSLYSHALTIQSKLFCSKAKTWLCGENATKESSPHSSFLWNVMQNRNRTEPESLWNWFVGGFRSLWYLAAKVFVTNEHPTQSLTSQRNGSYRGHAICWRSDISIHQVAPQQERRDRDSKRDRTKEKEEDVPWHKSGGEFLRSRRIRLTHEWGASVQKHF